MEQEIRFCTASDGVRIAWSTVGTGPPLVKAANWLNHLEFDWQSPIWRHWFAELSRDHRLVRYDERGNGLSDWDVGELSLEAFVADLEAVVDAAEIDRFVLLGISQGCAVSVTYAVRHPERVSHLVLYGGYARGWKGRGTPEDRERRLAMQTLAAQGWGQDNPAYRQLFTSIYVPGATREEMDWFNDLQRVSASPERGAPDADPGWPRRHGHAAPCDGTDARSPRAPGRVRAPLRGTGAGRRDPRRAVRHARQREPHSACRRTCMAPLPCGNAQLSRRAGR
jgi:pimeloyl-ACP methyl ester carboxylesterase